MGSTLARLLIIFASVTPALAFCGSFTHLQPRNGLDSTVPISTFGYIGATGPTRWSFLSANNSRCSTGTRQSPINLIKGQFTVVPSSEMQLTMPDFPGGVYVENLGTTVEAVTPAGRLVTGGVTYRSRQLHLHHPSEHLDNGKSLAFEMHWVFEAADSRIAVIAVLIDVDPTPAAGLSAGNVPGWAHAHAHSRVGRAVTSRLLETLSLSVAAVAVPGTRVRSGPLALTELVDTLKLGSFAAYSGSLTTPPCLEQISWLVAEQRLLVSVAAHGRVVDVVGFNSRFPQAYPGERNVLASVVTA